MLYVIKYITFCCPDIPKLHCLPSPFSSPSSSSCEDYLIDFGFDPVKNGLHCSLGMQCVVFRLTLLRRGDVYVSTTPEGGCLFALDSFSIGFVITIVCVFCFPLWHSKYTSVCTFLLLLQKVSC